MTAKTINNKQQTCNQTPITITPSRLPPPHTFLPLQMTPYRIEVYPFTMRKCYARKSPIRKEPNATPLELIGHQWKPTFDHSNEINL